MQATYRRVGVESMFPHDEEHVAKVEAEALEDIIAAALTLVLVFGGGFLACLLA